MGIRAKLILSTCIPLLIIYASVLAWDYWNSRQQALQQIEQLVAQRASAEAGQVNGWLAGIQTIANRTAFELARGQATGAVNESGGPPPEPTTGPNSEPGPSTSGPNRGGGRGGNADGGPPRLFRNGVPGDRNFGRSVIEGLTQSPLVGAIWYRFDPAFTRSARTPEAFGLRHASAGGAPFESFHPTTVATAGWFEKPLRDQKSLWLEPDDVNDASLGRVCVFAEPFYVGQDAKPAGVVCISVPSAALRFIRADTPVQSQLRQILTGAASVAADASIEPPSLAKGGYLLIGRNGRILSRPDGQAEGKELAVGPDDDELRAAIDRSLKGSGAIVVAGGLDRALGESVPNSRYVLAMEQTPASGWLFVTAQSESDLLGPVHERLIKRGLFLVGSLFVLVAVVTLVLTRFCRPIEQMAVTVQQLARGELDIAPVPVLANDELGQLASGFNDMTGRLRHHVRELTEQSAEREKVEGELRIARQIQRDLLPRTFPPFPHRAEFDLHAVNIPARHIAGDFFDFFFSTDDLLTIVIADVSGKGVPAALMMAVTRTMVRNLAEAGMGPREIVERVNRMLIQDTTPGLFVTMVLGQYEVSTGRLTYVNAGHPPAVCFCPNSLAKMCCEPTGPLLGVDAGDALGPFEQQTITLSPGEGVLFYTDGVTEAHDQTNVMFGEVRLCAQVTALRDRPTPDLCEGVVSAIMGYQHQSVADDVTLVCIRREPGR